MPKSSSKESQAGIGTLTGRKAEIELHSLVLDECVDDAVLNLILPDDKPHSWEGALWDYKREFPSTSGRGTPDEIARANLAIAELIKDVVAFHNSYGGYILGGIEQHSETSLVGCQTIGPLGFTVEKLNEQLLAYTRVKIDCKFRKIIKSGGSELGLLLVPMRSSNAPVVVITKGAPQKTNKTGTAFKKGDIFARISDTCAPVHNDLQGLQFVCGKRRLSIEAPVFPHIENNLPPKDPNIIRFVGRTDYFLKLWGWLIDRHTPVKIMTALGGTGKTAIAYEFCLHLLSDPPAWMSKLIWLTAKKQSYSAIQGTYVGVTRTDFDSVTGFLRSLASEIGVMDLEILEAESDDELMDLLLHSLDAFPSMIVVDGPDGASIHP